MSEAGHVRLSFIGYLVRRLTIGFMMLGLCMATTFLLSGCMQSAAPKLTSCNVVVTATSAPVQHNATIQLNLTR